MIAQAAAAVAVGGAAGAAVLAVRAADQAAIRAGASSLSTDTAPWSAGRVAVAPEGRHRRVAGLAAFLRRPRRRLDGLRATVEVVGRAVRSGASLTQAIEAAASEVPLPVGADLRSVVYLARHGDGLVTGLRWWSASRPDDDDVRMLAGALAVAAGTGGGAAAAVEACGQVLADRADLAGEIASLTSQAKASAVVIGAAPLLMVAIAATSDPATATFLFTTAPGLGLLLGGLGLDAAGAAWMALILRRPR